MATVTIRNDVPRRDTAGEILDCHDGCLRFVDGRYYLYGTRYFNSNGYQPIHRFGCYSSSDLTNWTNHGDLIPDMPAGLAVRPYVRFNRATDLHVLWFNWYEHWTGTTNWAAGDGPTPGLYGVAVADRPQGPFKMVHDRSNLAPGVGDLNLFVDHDQTGYIIYTRIKHDGVHINFQMCVERLAGDYLSATGERSEVIDQIVEAPALFRRNEFYYALFGRTCCFCPEGADVRVYRATSPLGPYELRGNLNIADDSIGKPIRRANYRVALRPQMWLRSTRPPASNASGSPTAGNRRPTAARLTTFSSGARRYSLTNTTTSSN